MMAINFFDYQKKAINQLRIGSILRGGVGSGKSITSLGFYIKECGGSPFKDLPMTKPIDLYIITTPRKRDSLDWEKEAAQLMISKDPKLNIKGTLFIVDSWNNIGKYKDIKNAFFIFDEQKVIGSGSWVKSFIRITKQNKWILLTATPGDTWSDYIPIFVANGFYENRTQFISEHVVYNTFTNYPKIDRYVNEQKLEKLKQNILVEMEYEKKTVEHITRWVLPYDTEKFNSIYVNRWNPFKNSPVKTAAEACYLMRQVVNSDPSRIESILQLLEKHKKLIVFYNFDPELELLRTLKSKLEIPIHEYNGHIHEPIPEGNSWIYIVQYNSASEAWNCIETNAVILYSRNYSYKQTIQAMGRIDRQNTPFLNLYYYFFTSDSPIDKGIELSFNKKKNFNAKKFISYKE